MPTGLTHQSSNLVTSCGWTAVTGELHAQVGSWNTSTMDRTAWSAPSERTPRSRTNRQPYTNTEPCLYPFYMMPATIRSRDRWFRNHYW